MRVESRYISDVTGYRAAPSRSGPGDSFELETAKPLNAAVSSEPLVTATGIDTLLALQAADDPLQKRRRAVRRGKDVLDALDEVKSDVLLGRVSEGRLNHLLGLLGQARERTLPGLDSVLDDIELRARVELAKLGRFAGG